MGWSDQPSIRGGGKNIAKERRAEHYANPPSNPGLCGLQINKAAERRKMFIRDGVTSTATYFARKGEPFR